MDRTLWKVERYRDFLAVRRELLAEAANKLLDGLAGGGLPEAATSADMIAADGSVVATALPEEEDRILAECQDWLAQRGLPSGELNFELVDPDSGEPAATLDLAWPSGLQEGLSGAVALLIDEAEDIHELAAEAGYRYFTDVRSFQQYVEAEILASPSDEDDEGAEDAPTTRADWIARTSDPILRMADALLDVINANTRSHYGTAFSLNYHRNFIGLSDGERARNFVVFRPRKKYLRLAPKVADVETWRSRLLEKGVDATATKSGRLRANVTPAEFETQRAVLDDLVRAASDEHHA